MQGNNQSGINDDELNKMIASIQNEQRQGGTGAASNSSYGAKIVQPPAAPRPTPNNFIQPSQSPAPASDNAVNIKGQMPSIDASPTDTQQSAPAQLTMDSLINLKRETISELRPLIDKLNIDPADKFDALLLILRTTDDGSLLTDAHNTAMQIADDSRRAQALLDVIKEIDYFSNRHNG